MTKSTNSSFRPGAALAHVFLIAGAVLFVYPFLWMITASMKVPRELLSENLTLFPASPQPQARSPWIDARTFPPPSIPEGITPEVWAQALPAIDKVIAARLAAWTPATPGKPTNAPPGPLDRTALDAEMREGILGNYARLLTDDARRAAQEDPAAAVATLAAEAERLVDDAMLVSTFDALYRRFALAGVRVRDSRYVSHMLDTPQAWQVIAGSAQLVVRDDATPDVCEVRYNLPSPGDALAIHYAPKTALPVAAADIDRVYVSWRADDSWARVTYEVTRAGRRYRGTSVASLWERDWVEQELRWPEGDRDPMARRAFTILRDIGPAAAGAPEFSVTLHVTRQGLLGGWWAKLSRNYWAAFREVAYMRFLMTSFSLAILNIVLAVFSCTLVAYAFARLQWPGRDLCFGILLATMMLPPQVTMIPQFIIIKEIGWFNTLLPLWVMSAFGAPFFIFLLRQFFKNIPTDLEDAARIDGCGFLMIYWHVMLPLVKPVIATIAIFTFMGSWNNFMGPLIYVSDERLFPLSLGLFKFNTLAAQGAADSGLMMAGAAMMTLPMIVLFAFCQRYFVQGITLTGTKA